MVSQNKSLARDSKSLMPGTEPSGQSRLIIGRVTFCTPQRMIVRCETAIRF